MKSFEERIQHQINIMEPCHGAEFHAGIIIELAKKADNHIKELEDLALGVSIFGDNEKLRTRAANLLKAKLGS